MGKKNNQFFHYAELALTGKRKWIRSVRLFLGPAFIASVAYIDPGNFASNIQGGAEFGYLLVWVIVTANLMGIFIQLLSAKLGIASEKNLAELCRDHYKAPINICLWVISEIIAMATDIAEFIGAALGFYLLFSIPLLHAAILTAMISFLLLGMQKKGFRPLEIAITCFVAVIVFSFAVQVFFAKPNLTELASGFIPHLKGTKSILLASAILGATVMPHVIFLHSALTQKRIIGDTHEKKRKLYHFQMVDVYLAMGIAGLINLSMLVLSAALFYKKGALNISDIEPAFYAIGDFLGPYAKYLFGVALLSSGLSSSLVGTMAGQVIMQGFVRFPIPLFLRRLLTMLPSLIIIASGFSPTDAMVISQVVLSFGIPFALIPLIFFTKNKKIMGNLANKPITNVILAFVAIAIISLNLFLLKKTFF